MAKFFLINKVFGIKKLHLRQRTSTELNFLNSMRGRSVNIEILHCDIIYEYMTLLGKSKFVN